MSKTNDANKLTLTIVDIISSWAVNNFYNSLHQFAIKIHSSGNSSSITDAYLNVVNQYLMTLNNNDGYKKSVQLLHTYCIDYTTYAGMSFSAWISEIVRQFVPTDYYDMMTNEQRDTVLRSIIVNSLQQFSSELVSSPTLLNDVIMRTAENRSQTINSLRSIMVQNLLAARQQFLRAVHAASMKTNVGTTEIALKRELADLLKSNVELKHKLNKANKSLEQQSKLIAKQKDALRRLSNEHSVAKEKIVAQSKPVFRPTFLTPPIRQPPPPQIQSFPPPPPKIELLPEPISLFSKTDEVEEPQKKEKTSDSEKSESEEEIQNVGQTDDWENFAAG